MPIVRITEKGWEKFTGPLGDIEFKDGVSVEVITVREAERLGCLMSVVNADTGENPSSVQRMVDERAYSADVMAKAQEERAHKEALIQAEKERAEKLLQERLAEHYSKESPREDTRDTDFAFYAEGDEIAVVQDEPESQTESTPSFNYDLKDLEEIADEGGLHGLREFAAPYDVRGKSISSIIKTLMVIKSENSQE